MLNRVKEMLIELELLEDEYSFNKDYNDLYFLVKTALFAVELSIEKNYDDMIDTISTGLIAIKLTKSTIRLWDTFLMDPLFRAELLIAEFLDSKKKKVIKKEESYHVIGVRFNGSKVYNYLCHKPEYKVGEIILIHTRYGEQKAEIVSSTTYHNKRDLPYAFEKMSYVESKEENLKKIRKLEAAEYEQAQIRARELEKINKIKKEKEEIRNKLSSILNKFTNDLYYKKDINHANELAQFYLNSIEKNTNYKEDFSILQSKLNKIKNINDKRKIKKRIWSILIGILATISLYLLIFTFIIPETKYQKALDLIENGKYDDAEDIFYDIYGYKDSISQKERIKELKYKKAIELFENDDYNQAKSIFNQLYNYKDTKKYLEIINVYDSTQNKDLDTLVDYFNENNYKIIFNIDYNGGKQSNKTIKLYGEYVYTSEKNGYTFYKYNVIGHSVDVSKLTLNINIKAEYQINKYKITYILNGGTNHDSNPNEYTCETEMTLSYPLKKGYDFIGWSTDKNGQPIKDFQIKKGTINNLTFYANYKATEYEIHYNLNGGINNDNNPTSYNIESNDLNIINPTKHGYVFKGWKLVDTDELIQNFQIKTGSIGNISLSAIWEPINYSITYNLNGGINNINNPLSFNIETNDFIIQSPTKSGYSFIGWSFENDNNKVIEPQIHKGTIGNLLLTANWSENAYKIFLNVNGGDKLENSIVTVDFDNEYILPNPTKTAYTFVGWYEGDTLIDSTGIWTYTCDKTYDAKWTPITYTISYNLNGGEFKSDYHTNYNCEQSITLASPYKKGYSFAGWTNSEIENPTLPLTINKGEYGNKTYIANYIPNDYTITFDPQGGIIEKMSINIKYDEQINLPTPIKEGYYFKYWSYNETEYTDNIFNEIENITLKAVWEANDYTIRIIDEQTQSFKVKYDSNYTIKSSLKENFIFKGYFSQPYGKGTKFTNDDGNSINIYNLTNDIDLYPYYQYSIDFITNGGTDIETIIYDENEYLDSKIIPYKKNRNFDGWYLNETLTEIYQGGIGNVVVYAKWLEETTPSKLKYTKINDKIILNFGYSTNGNLVIPSHIGGLEVTEIDTTNTPYSDLKYVFIPKTVTTIREKAYNGFTGLVQVDFEEDSNLQKIESFAFSNTKLEKIIIPNSVSDISYGIFYGCNNLIEVSVPFVGSRFGYIFDNSKTNENYNSKIPSSLKTIRVSKDGNIPEYCFYGVGYINEISIEAETCTLNKFCFYDSRVTKLKIPKKVDITGEHQFYIDNYGKSYPSILYYDGNVEDWCNINFDNGNPFSAMSRHYFNLNDEWTELVDLTIPSTVINIGANKFQNFTSIKTITLNKELTSISPKAFSSCSNLHTVYLESNSKLEKIERSAFENCSNLKSVPLLESLKYIGSSAFAYTGIEEFYIPNTVEEIGYAAFAGCSKLGKLTFESNSNLKTIDQLAFNGCKVLEELVIPSSIEKIGGSAFSNCNLLESVTFESEISLVSIGAFAFENCYELETIELPDCLTDIGKGILAGCKKLTSFSIPFIGQTINEPAKLIHIFLSSGWNCSTNDSKFIPYSLTDVKVTKQVTFAEGTFQGCGNIKNLYINNTIAEFNNVTFDGCNNLINLYFNGTISDWCNITLLDDTSNPMYYATNFYYYNDNSYELLEHLIIPEEITIINENQFFSFESIKSIVISNDVEKICKNAFKKCINVIDISFMENSKLNYIEKNAFISCSNLLEIHFPQNVQTIEDNVLEGCYKVQRITIPFLTKYMFGRIFNYSEERIYLGGGKGYSYKDISNENVPDSLKEVVILSGTLYENSFKNCEYIKKISIPDTITYIPVSAFANMYNLSEINIPSGLINIDEGAFINCGKLKIDFSFSSLINIGNNAFSNCYSLENIVIPKSVETLGSYAFSYCTSLKKIIFENEITIIPIGCFSSCENLTEFFIPASITTIDKYAFNECENLTLIEFENNSKLTTIKEGAFSRTSLISFIAPDTLRYISSSSFNYTSSLIEFVINKNTSISYDSFVYSNLKEITFKGDISECSIPTYLKDSQIQRIICNDGEIDLSK